MNKLLIARRKDNAAQHIDKEIFIYDLKTHKVASYFVVLLILVGMALAATPAIAQSTFAMDGLEVTQSVQHYKSGQHLRDSRDYGADNSIPLIAGKTTYIRAYVRRLSGAAVPVVGTLTVERQTSGGWAPVTTIESIRAVTPRSQQTYSTQRGDLTRTLNFILPGSQVEGAMRFTATARRTTTTTVVAQSQVTMATALRRALRIAAITVGYKGPTSPTDETVITAPAPGRDVVETVASDTVAAFPVRDAAPADFRVVGSITLGNPLFTEEAPSPVTPQARVLNCPKPWTDLITEIRKIRRADGAQDGWLYYGLLANQIPYSSRTRGCGGGGVGTGKVNRPLTMMHELGHAAGQPHIPGINDDCTGDNEDRSYPIYEKLPSGSYPRGSIGEYGLNTRTGVLMRPRQVSDIMQYCEPRWISPWIYNRLIEQNVFNDQNVSLSGADRFPYQPLTVLIAVLQHDGAIENPSVMDLVTRAKPIGINLNGMHAELADDAGRVIATAPVQSTSLREGNNVSQSGDPNCPCIIEALLPQGGPSARVRIVHGSQVIFESERRNASSLELSLQAVPSRDRVALSWAGIEADQKVWIRLSDDGGKTWAMLNVGVHTNRRYSVAREQLPESSPLLFEILSFDATQTRRAVSSELHLLSK